MTPNTFSTTKELQKLLRCSDFRLATPIIYEIMVGDPCCDDCHMGNHREFGKRVSKNTTYTVCCAMTSFCLKQRKASFTL